GIVLKMIIHLVNGVPLMSLFRPVIDVQDLDETTALIEVRESAVFSNWIPFRRQIEQIGLMQRRNLIVDVSHTRLVDHSVMEKLDEMERDFRQEGLTFEVRGLDSLQPFSRAVHSARKRGLATVKRLTIVADDSIEQWLTREFAACGATGYTAIPCWGAGRRQLENGGHPAINLVRIEVVVTQEVCEKILAFLRREVLCEHPVTTCVETVDVLRVDDF